MDSNVVRNKYLLYGNLTKYIYICVCAGVCGCLWVPVGECVFVGCVVLAITRLTTKQNKVRHSTLTFFISFTFRVIYINIYIYSYTYTYPFFCAALAKRWKVQFRQGLA